MPRSGSRSSSSSSSDYSDSSSDPEVDPGHPGWRSALADKTAEEWRDKKRKSSSSTDEGDSETERRQNVVPRGSEGLSYGVNNPEDDEDTDDMDDEDRAFASLTGGWGRKSSVPVMTWPPAVAVNSNRPELTGAAPGGKKKKPGIIYLSAIPPGFNVSRTTGFFAQYGKIGRVYLQPDGKEKANRKDKLARNFTEGWVEFMSKKLAKEVASNLNLTQVGGKKRSKSHDVIWNIKYLTGFKWTHLSEKLAYEKAVHAQRMRTEISQAKRETDFFKSNLEKSKRGNADHKRKASRPTASDTHPASPPKRPRTYEFRQKETDEAVRQAKKAKSSGNKKKSAVPLAAVSAPLKSDQAVESEVKREMKEESEDEDSEEQAVSPAKRRRASGGEEGEGPKARRASGETKQATSAVPPNKKQRQKVKKPTTPPNGGKANKSSKAGSGGKRKGGQGETSPTSQSAKVAATSGNASKSKAGKKNGAKKTGPPDRGELLKSLM